MPLDSHTNDEGSFAIVRTPNGLNPDVTTKGTSGYAGVRRGVTFVDGEARVPLEAGTDDYDYCKDLLKRFAFDDGYTVTLPTGEYLPTPATTPELETRRGYRKVRVRAASKIERPMVEA